MPFNFFLDGKLIFWRFSSFDVRQQLISVFEMSDLPYKNNCTSFWFLLSLNLHSTPKLIAVNKVKNYQPLISSDMIWIYSCISVFVVIISNYQAKIFFTITRQRNECKSASGNWNLEFLVIGLENVGNSWQLHDCFASQICIHRGKQCILGG